MDRNALTFYRHLMSADKEHQHAASWAGSLSLGR
jgi:hypothetical protein